MGNQNLSHIQSWILELKGYRMFGYLIEQNRIQNIMMNNENLEAKHDPKNLN